VLAIYWRFIYNHVILQTRKTVFDHISKHREESLKMRRVVECFWQTSRCLEIWSDTVLSDTSSQSNLNWLKLRRRRRNKIVDYLWWLRPNILTPSRSWFPLLMSLRTNSKYFGRFNPAHVFIKLKGNIRSLMGDQQQRHQGSNDNNNNIQQYNNW